MQKQSLTGPMEGWWESGIGIDATQVGTLIPMKRHSSVTVNTMDNPLEVLRGTDSQDVCHAIVSL